MPSRIIKMGIGRMNQDILDLFDYVSIGDTVTLTLLSGLVKLLVKHPKPTGDHPQQHSIVVC